MEKVLVLGNKGMLGHILFDLLRNKPNKLKYKTYGINRSNSHPKNNSYKLDVLDFEKLNDFIKLKKPDFVINCVGSLIKTSLEKPSVAIQTNSLLPHFLNKISYDLDFKLIHISTDCVFNGKKGNYLESDFKNETNYYGLTKNLGEINNKKNLTIRTSIIGPELKKNPTGLFNWIFSQQGKEINGFSNAIWSGLTTLELSKFIIWSLDKDYNGIIHATNNSSISKHDLIKLIIDNFNLNVILNKHSDYKVDKSLLNTKIKDYSFPTYLEMIKEIKIKL